MRVLPFPKHYTASAAVYSMIVFRLDIGELSMQSRIYSYERKKGLYLIRPGICWTLCQAVTGQSQVGNRRRMPAL